MQLSNAIYENEIRDYFMKNVRIHCFFFLVTTFLCLDWMQKFTQ